MHKVPVSQEAPDRKRIQSMLKKNGFLAPKRNSSSLSIYHFDWTDFFLSATDKKSKCRLSPEFNNAMHLSYL